MDSKILSIMDGSIDIDAKEDIVMSYYKNEDIIKQKKELGQIFTPSSFVSKMLNDIGYVEGNILDKKIMENSFGNGSFLITIVSRLITECQKNNLTNDKIKEQLENNVYGIEVDKDLYNETIHALNNLVSDFCNIEDVHWRLYNQDTLLWSEFGLFDFVIGNPPYVRIHNYPKEMRQNLKNFSFSKGTTDLYVIFFEIGINMLNQNGKLAYITPNSYLKNKSQGNFRQYLLENNLVDTVIDYGSTRVFDNAETYACITIINKKKKDLNLNYYKICKDNEVEKNVFSINKLKTNGVFDPSPWNLCSMSDFALMEQIEKRAKKLGMYANIQNGFATCRDSVYILKDPVMVDDGKFFKKDDYLIEAGICKKIVKASTYHGKSNDYIIFPYIYDPLLEKNIPLDEHELKTLYPHTYAYLLDNKEELLKRDMDTSALNWYEYARNQGLSNCNKPKIVINSLMSNDQIEVECYKLSADIYVYSGLFATCNNEETLDFVYDIMKSRDCCRYLKIKGKDMSNGFKSFSSVALKEFGISNLSTKIFDEKKNTIDQEFLKRIKKSYGISVLESPRSNKKVIPIHSFIAEVMSDCLGSEYKIHSLGFEKGKEKEIKGKINNKDVDICISKNDIDLGVIEVKFPCNSLQKNFTNYIENMMGETKNIKDASICCAQVIVYPSYTPCYKGTKLERVEENISERILKRYYDLHHSDDKDSPDFVFMPLIDLGNKKYLSECIGKAVDNSELVKNSKISYLNMNDVNFEDDDLKQHLKESQSLRNFVEDYAHLIRTKDLQQ